MEARNITVVSTLTQNKQVISSSAETLRELKNDLRANNIKYDGLVFFEGISKTEIVSDEALLPRDLSWKGAKTNDLVFLLTEPQKKIKNGAVQTRSEAYAFIKKHNLQAKVEKTFLSNFTRCKTVDLIDFCNKNIGKTETPATKKVVTKRSCRQIEQTLERDNAAPSSTITFNQLINLLVAKNILSDNEVRTGQIDSVKHAVVSDNDIAKMFENI
nr:MAG TPA: hypothetical protein [Caudoviricetes sp.]